VAAEGTATVLRMLDERRTNLTRPRTRPRTRTVNQLHALLRELPPGGAPTDLTADRAAALLAQIRPSSPVERARKELARELVDAWMPGLRRAKPAWPRSFAACDSAW
jgi:hypothetical protein